MLNGKSILITGGTGTFGQFAVKMILTCYEPARLIIFSRGEFAQSEMRQELPAAPCLRWFIGDVRDRSRVMRAFTGVDVVIHAAALKQVLACEYNPFEAVQTNIIGSMNVIDAAIDRGVKKVIAISSDKSVAPLNTYGATKMCMEKLFVNAGSYSSVNGTVFGAVRYGNVAGSRGSVVPLFAEQAKRGTILITHPEMTRFWLTIEQGVEFALARLENMTGGEIFVPKIPSVYITDLADVIAPSCKRLVIGTRPGEKLHESLITEGEHAIDCGDYFAIVPPDKPNMLTTQLEGLLCEERFRYRSDLNGDWLTMDDLRKWWKGEQDKNPV